MIKSVKSGGIISLIIAIVFAIGLNFIPFYRSFELVKTTNVLPGVWVNRIVFIVFFLIQSFWFQRVIHGARFFEHWSILPWVIFISIGVLTPDQFVSLRILAPNFILLIFYQKLFYHQDRELTNYQIFLEAGVLSCIGSLFYPKFICLLPFLIILLNQFSANDLNRIYLVVVSFLMVALSALVIGYIFVSPEWVSQLWISLHFQFDLNALLEPGLMYSYIAIIGVLLLLTPVVYNRLTFMQTQNRLVINMLYLQLIFVLALALFSGKNAYEVMLLASLPLTFIISFGAYHVKSRWLGNIVVLLFLFTFVLIQVEYMW